MNFQNYLQVISGGTDLSRGEAERFLSLILDDQNLSDADIAKALTALTEKNPSIEEVCGFVDAMKSRMTHIHVPKGAIDVCGTGGDKSGTFNISTVSAILLAAGGVHVAKHGNRAATSKCGSSDVLEALGIPIDLVEPDASRYLVDHHFVFLFAQLYHPSLKRLAIIRKQLGFPTVFNLLGPLLNPAGVRRQVIGTFSLDNARLLAKVIAQMNYEHAIVLTSEDGLDEASLSSPVHIFEIKGSSIMASLVNASDYGLEPADATELAGGDAKVNAKIIDNVLQPAENLSSHQRVVVFNAGIGFYVAGKRTTIAEGIQLAQDTLATDKGYEKLKELQR